MDPEHAARLIHAAIDVVNQQLPAARRLNKSPDTVIVGPSGSLDSLGIVNFVITLEEKTSEAIGRPVQLLDETALIEANGPFRTIGTLTTYLAGMPLS